jgi:enamine deaminase RidA (YjgF/YER057c/UK114 family)
VTDAPSTAAEGVLQVLEPRTAELISSTGPASLSVGSGTYLRSGDLAFVSLSGQVAFTDGKIVGKDDIRAQTTQALIKARDLLASVGGTLQDVVRTRYFVKSPEPGTLLPEVGVARASMFGTHAPASTFVGVAGLAHPDILIEIELEAIINLAR